jgi:hypothetical protein
MNIFRRKALALVAFIWVSPATAGCLTLEDGGSGFSFWVNHCSSEVYVSWKDKTCNWNCGQHIGAHGKQTTIVRGTVHWCEFMGSYFGKGPC